MLNVQNLYGTPQIHRKRPCHRPRRMTLIDLRSARAESGEEMRYRKSGTGTTKAEVGSSQFYSKHGILPIYDSTDSLDCRLNVATMRLSDRSSVFDGTTRFPKLTECAHFHYDFVELGSIQVWCLSGELTDENYRHKEAEAELPQQQFTLRVISGKKVWSIQRSYENFRQFDRQLHKCIFDRKFSHLPELQPEWAQTDNNGEGLLCRYMESFSLITGSMINCGPILNWLELDNRGNRLLAVDDSGINTPAIAAAHAVKRYTAQSADEISLEVGDIVSVIDMPPAEDTIWWRGKRGFEVGFFPSECVEVIGDKVPQSMASRIPDPPQKAVLRKHGKLITFFRTFFSNRPSRNELKQSGIVKERVFGCDLGEHLLNSGHDVPLVLKCCADVIQNHGIVDGIYRLSGIASNIQKLRLAFDEDRAPDLMSENYLQDIHSISSLLKMYFRELPNPLLTYQLYDKFAEAVRDEDNKLLKIHDVVQQLPPPHYRTTEYLMRHLARVAAEGLDTGMHSKNLAIVWAPNLLRSKELEMGGGAAALQGVGIQAVVTEFLICYADLIFSDKIPVYSSPDSIRSQKKLRPKSLAISTPTRLLSLEEARERALTTSIAPPQKFVEVGGGPENLPDKYHTVLDLPGYKKKAKDSKEVVKQKKSPVSGWKSFFSKSRSSSMKVSKGRKSSVPDPLALGEQKAITEEDVHNWKRRRLRTAKSVESLLTARGSHFFDFGSLDSSTITSQSESQNLPRKRGSSSSSRSRSQSLDRNMFGSSSSRETVKEMAIDIGPVTKPGSMRSEGGGPDKENASPGESKSFIRGDQTRRAIAHRKTASAPANQLHLETSPPSVERRRVSQQSCDTSSLRRKKPEKMGKAVLESGHCEISVPITDHTISRGMMSDKFLLRVDNSQIFQPQEQTMETKGSSKADKSGKGNKTKKKGKCAKEKEVVCTVELRESPSVRRKHNEEMLESASPCRPEPSVPQTYYSPHHDYAEILEDERDIEEHETRVQQDMEKANRGRANLLYTQTFGQLEEHNITEQDNRREGEVHPDTSMDRLMSELEQFEHSIHERPSEYDNPRMSKSLSIPSDIQRSVDNVNLDSQSDLMSSVTISELSRSVDSFNMALAETEGQGALWRSSSLDCEQESPLGRTLHEINAQIDQAFKRDPCTPNEQLYMYPVEESLRFSVSDAGESSVLLQQSYGEYDEDSVATPTNERQFDFDCCYSTVPTATMHLQQDCQYTSVESLSVPVESTSLHISEPDLHLVGEESTQTGGTTELSWSQSHPDSQLKYDVVRAPLRSTMKETSQITETSLERRKEELDLAFIEIQPIMRESQLTEGEYVQLEDEDYVRLQADAQLANNHCVVLSLPSDPGERTPTSSDSAPIPTSDLHTAAVPINLGAVEQTLHMRLALSNSDENFWQNTEFPGLSPLSDVIEAYCCKIEPGETVCEGSQSPADQSLDRPKPPVHHHLAALSSGEGLSEEASTGDSQLVPDVEVTYQIDFRKSGGFDILADADVVQEVSAECYICSNVEEGVLSIISPEENDRSPTKDHSWTGQSSLELVEERKLIQKADKPSELLVASRDGEESEPTDYTIISHQLGPSPCVEELYAEMLQHGLGQTPESDFVALETALSYQHPETEASSGKRAYLSMVEEQRYVDSLISQHAFGIPVGDSPSSPVKKLKEGQADCTPSQAVLSKTPPACPRQISAPRHDELIAVRPKLTKVVKERHVEMCMPEIISVHELTSEKGQAKLIVERRPIDWKKVQTVHATRVEQPAKQHAESLDSLSSLSRDIWPLALKSSKSHESLREGRNRVENLPLRMTSSVCESHEYYGDMGELVISPDTLSTSLTSSTDTSLSLSSSLYLDHSSIRPACSVQKASSMPNVGRWSPPVDSEQHATLQRHSGLSKSGKLQSLKELFEPSSAENSSADLKDERCLWRSTSQPASSDRQTAPQNVTRFSQGPHTTDASCGSVVQSAEDGPQWHVSGIYLSQDQNLPPTKETTTAHKKTVLQRWQCGESESNAVSAIEPGLDYSKRRVRIADNVVSLTGKPPVYRSSPLMKSRTHSDSALEESHVSNSQPSDEEVFTGEMSTHSLGWDKSCGLEHKESIRELMAVFEGDATSTANPDCSELTSSRDSLEVIMPNVMELSRESDSTRGPSPVTSDSGLVRPQSMRLGPKPFYGSKS